MGKITPLNSNRGLMVCMLAVVAGGWGYLSWAKTRPYPSGSLREISSPQSLQPEVSGFSIERIGSVDIPGPATDLSIDGSVMYAAMTNRGFATFDISEPSKPVMVTHLKGNQLKDESEKRTVLSVHPEPDRLLVLDRQMGLTIYDNSDPLRPTLDWVKTIPGTFSDRVVGIERIGDYYYLACGGSGLRTLEVGFDKDTEVPAVLKFFDHTRETAFLEPNWLLVTDGERAGLQVIDISEPARPRPVGMMRMSGFVDRIVVFDHYAAVVARPWSLRIVDFSDPTEPFITNWHERLQGSLIRSVDLWNDRYLLIGNRFGFLEILDLKNPEEPIFMDQLQLGGDVKGVTVEDDLLYVGFWDKSKINVYKMSVTEG